jgi:hypothetical protein
MSRDLSLSLHWTTEQFDYRAEIPEEHNAGNRFFGRDLAAFLSERLRGDDLQTDFVDEDWGWLVLGKSASGQFVEVAIYNLGDDGSEPRKGSSAWGLWIRMFEKRPWLLLLRKNTEIACQEWFLDRLKGIENAAAIKSAPWVDGPSNREAP